MLKLPLVPKTVLVNTRFEFPCEKHLEPFTPAYLHAKRFVGANCTDEEPHMLVYMMARVPFTLGVKKRCYTSAVWTGLSQSMQLQLKIRN